MSYISSENVLETITEIGEFEGSLDNMSGTLEWYNKKSGVTIYATPNWNIEGEVPFDVSTNGGECDYHNVFTIKLINGDISTQCTHYLNVLRIVMNHYSI